MSRLAVRWHKAPWEIDWNDPRVTLWALRDEAIAELETVARRNG